MTSFKATVRIESLHFYCVFFVLGRIDHNSTTKSKRERESITAIPQALKHHEIMSLHARVNTKKIGEERSQQLSHSLQEWFSSCYKQASLRLTSIPAMMGRDRQMTAKQEEEGWWFQSWNQHKKKAESSWKESNGNRRTNQRMNWKTWIEMVSSMFLSAIVSWLGFHKSLLQWSRGCLFVPPWWS